MVGASDAWKEPERGHCLTETNKRFSPQEWQSIHHTIARLRASVMAVVCGVLVGTALSVATLWLVLRGPAQGQTEVGLHLSLLNNFLPGYEVSLLGSLIGFLYGVLIGAIVGWTFAFVYNLIADRDRSSPHE